MSSQYGTLEVYGLVVQNEGKSVADLTDQHVLTNAQVSELIHTAENELIGGAPESYNSLQEIHNELSNVDSDVSSTLIVNLEETRTKRIQLSTELSSTLESNNTGQEQSLVNLSELLSTNISIDVFNDTAISTKISSEIHKADSTELIFSENISTSFSTIDQRDESLSTNLSTNVDTLTSDVTVLDTKLSSTRSEFQQYSTDFSNTLSLNEDASLNRKNTLDTAITDYQNSYTTNSNEISSSLSALSAEGFNQISAVSATLSDELTRHQQEVSTINVLNTTISNETATVNAQLNSEIINLSETINGKYAQNSENHYVFSTNMDTGYASLSTSIYDNKTNDTTQNTTLSNTQSTNQERIEAYGRLKISKHRPVIDGDLRIDSELHELKIGERWSIRSVTDDADNKSSLQFLYKDGDQQYVALPFFNHDRSIAINKRASNSSQVKFGNPQSLPLVAGETKLYYVIPTGDIEQTRYATIVSIDTQKSILDLNWGDVVPREGKYTLDINSSDDANLIDLYFM